MPPWPSSSTRRYRPPSVVPISVTVWVSPHSEVLGVPPAGESSAPPPDARPGAGVTNPAPPPRLDVERAQVLPELGTGVRPRERELDGRLEPAHRGAGVIAVALERVAEHALLVHQRLDGVGELDLAARAALRLLELLEDLGRQHVAPDHREVRRRVLGLRLLHQVRDAVRAVAALDRLARDDAVAAGLLARDLGDGDHRPVVLLVRV